MGEPSRETIMYAVLMALRDAYPEPVSYRALTRYTGFGRGQVHGAMQRLWRQKLVQHKGVGIYAASFWANPHPPTTTERGE